MSTLDKRNPIAKAVKYALLAGTAVTAYSAPSAFAAEEEAEEQKITITGSRLKRTDVETAQPVTIITRAELDMSGDTSVADALRNTSANSFGSWKGQSGYGAGATGSAEIDLRGVGATLVLVDGRRMPGAGYDGGATQNLNNIPLAIVERIEILRGGASAIYGSDAVAGVVNIITRSEVQGGSISATFEKRGIDDGKKTKYEFAAGVSGDKGSMLVVAEHTSIDELADNEVSGFDNGVSWYSPVANAQYYSAASWTANFNAYDGTQLRDDGTPYVDFVDADGDPSPYTAAEQYADDQNNWASEWDAGLCGSVANTVPQPTATALGGRCGYAYSNVTWLYPQQEMDSIWTKFSYELTSDIEFNARLGYVGTKTHSRYAPTPVSTNLVTMAPSHPGVPAATAADAWSNLYLYHRSALLGNRDAYFNDSSFDMVFGLEGFLDVGAGLDWTANYQRTLKDETLFNHNLINDVAFQQGLDDELFDPFNTGYLNGGTPFTTAEWEEHAIDFYKSVAHTGIFEVHQVKDIIDGNIGGEIMSNDTMSVGFVVGGEFEQTDFTQISDPESGQGFISGGSGGDDVFASRDRTSLYTEFAFNFDFGLEVSAAARYDKYEQSGDVGLDALADKEFSDTTTMISALYRPTDDLLIRAVTGEAFRAPTMPELFASASFGFPSGYDYYYCDTLGNPGNDATYCNATNQPQHLAWYGGNILLESENADTDNFGVVWNATDDWSLELGWYRIDYFDKIVNISINELMLLDQVAGGTSTAVTRGSDGKITSIQAGTANLARQKTSGWDFATAYNIETDIGKFVVKADLTRVIDYMSVDSDGNGRDATGLLDLPEMKANAQVSWSKDDYYAAWRMNFIKGQDATSASYVDIDNVMTHNIQFGMYTPWNGEAVIGIRNLTDEDTQYYTGSAGWRNYNTTLYSPEGRTLFFRYTQSF
ncbi:TonB-dependent receptor domain-containing protein [Aliikangiella sp. G2MR2-5]|uniref:TonB-dependent receptor domain-containing protein n=1 Tax=Aliikangiella sp. G2MR2-5 TaxID=2788943 RepID=UPI0018ABFFC8|nr:TonB-dependent receptor [Aliikangiella sp. G2MR2-5]